MSLEGLKHAFSLLKSMGRLLLQVYEKITLFMYGNKYHKVGSALGGRFTVG